MRKFSVNLKRNVFDDWDIQYKSLPVYLKKMLTDDSTNTGWLCARTFEELFNVPDNVDEITMWLSLKPPKHTMEYLTVTPNQKSVPGFYLVDDDRGKDWYVIRKVTRLLNASVGLNTFYTWVEYDYDDDDDEEDK